MRLVNVTKAAAVVVLLVWGTTANPGTSPDAKVRLSTTASGQEVPSQTPATLARRANSVRTADFHLRTGELIYGKLVAEDKNKITIERLDEGRIVVQTYGRREIDARTLDIKTVPEYRYYLDLADYFAGRTWDFRDDPDDFIQAIRCCEKAKAALGTSASAGQDSERIEQINDRIKKLEADRQVWETQVKSRAELKKLEFEAEAVNKLKELETKVNAGSQQVTKSVERLDKAVTDIQENHRKLEGGLYGIQQQLNVLAERTAVNARLMDPWRWNWQPQYFYRYRQY
jgi:hypothetical protein